MAEQTRRRFIASTAAVAALAPFISTSKSRAQAQGSLKKVGFAICGLGGFSETQIAPAFRNSQHCRLTGVVTGSPEKTGPWRAKYGIPERSVYSYDTIHRMADNPDIDVVYVVTPNALHAAHAIAAAKAGKHVICEKPLEVSVERCQQMIDACKSEKRLLATAYRCQFDPLHLECMRLAREKTFGAVNIVEAGFCVSIGDSDQWRLKHELSGGGALMDVGVYALQATRYITGEEPVLVTATETKTDPVKFKEVDESMVWTAKFPSGAVAYCSTSYKIPGIQRVRGSAEKGWFEMDPAFGFTGNRGRRSDGKEMKVPQIDLMAAQLDDFARCIREQRPTRVPGEEGLRDVRIMLAIYEAARTGRAVSLA
jgi:predicted dehydrogenase